MYCSTVYIHILIYTGLEAHVSNFFIYLLTLILTSVAASGVAFVFSALVDVFALANIMAAFTYVIMMVCCSYVLYIFVYSSKRGVPIWVFACTDIR